MLNHDLTHLHDQQLIQSLERLVASERQATAVLLAHIAETDHRRLYARDAFSSMFDFCTRHLHMSEDAAYKRIRAARCARQFPVVLDMISRGELHTSGVVLLSAHLTADNHAELLAAAKHRSKRGIEQLLAERFPSPDVPAVVRTLPRARQPQAVPLLTEAQPATAAAPEQAPGPVAPPPAPRPVLAPLAPERFKVQFTASRSLVDKLRRAQGLLGHRLPAADLATVWERALDVLIAELERERFGKGARPRRTAARPEDEAPSRHIPTAVKREVFERDGLRCTFVDSSGRRCQGTGFLELHHIRPFARGGEHSAANLAVVCRAHNAEAARRDFGPLFAGSSGA